VNKFDALNDITNVSNRSSVTNENKVAFVFINAILALARNIRVVIQIDKRIKVLEMESSSDNVEIAIVDVYCTTFRDRMINENREVTI
jgi:hypothetical protein